MSAWLMSDGAAAQYYARADSSGRYRITLPAFVRCGVRFVLLGGYGIDTELTIGRADAVALGGLTIPVISLADLIAHKRASGRPQDLADVILLERAARHR